jgi:uncharacterized protein with PIN domain
MKSATFQFHGSLNDLLSPSKRNTRIIYQFDDVPAIKHAIETIGVPHTEVDLIFVNDEPVDFFYSLNDNDRVEVYDAKAREKLPLSLSLTPAPAIPEKFILDVHLGKLARSLRLFGFDTLYENNYDDHAIVELSEAENRIVLTRDKNLLKHKSVSIAYFIRSQFPEEQLMEVINRFDLKPSFRFFKRCVECNGLIESVTKASVLDQLLPKTILYYNDFFQCTNCKRIYWRGSHYEHMQQFIDKIEQNVNNE